MAMNCNLWANLSINEKIILIQAAYPNRSKALVAFEANKTWKNLLPSTRQDLEKVEWKIVAQPR